MKSLNLARPLLILVVGLPGAGKSFFAGRFSETFGAPIISCDRLRYSAFAKPMYSADEQQAVGRLGDHLLEELVKTKRSFLVDGGCNTKLERLKYYRFAKKHGYDVFVVWVQADSYTAKQRALRRSSTREGDKYSRSLTSEQYAAHTKRFMPPTSEVYVVISGKHTYTTQAKTVLRRLAAPRAEAAAKIHVEQREMPVRPEAKTSKVPPRSVPAPTPPRRNVIVQ